MRGPMIVSAFKQAGGEGGPLMIKGYFSTYHKDREKDIIVPIAFTETLASRPQGYLPVVRNHDPSTIAGHAEKSGVDELGAWAECSINDELSQKQILAGDLRAFSWYGYVEEWLWADESPDLFLKTARENGIPDAELEDARCLVLKVDLIELTLTPTPANPYAIFDVLKAATLFSRARKQPAPLRSFLMGTRKALDLPGVDSDLDESPGATAKAWSVVPSKAYPVAPAETPWSFSAADGDALLGDNENWAAYKAAHTVYDPAKADTKGGYKLPHHKLLDGAMKTILRGVQVAGGVLMGARGGMDLGGAESGAKAHLSKHYKECDAEAPWDKSAEAWREELCSLLLKRTSKTAMLGYAEFEDAELFEMLRVSYEKEGVGRKDAEGAAAALLAAQQVTPPTLGEDNIKREHPHIQDGVKMAEEVVQTDVTPAADAGAPEAVPTAEKVDMKADLLAWLTQDEEVKGAFVELMREAAQDLLPQPVAEPEATPEPQPVEQKSAAPSITADDIANAVGKAVRDAIQAQPLQREGLVDTAPTARKTTPLKLAKEAMQKAEDDAGFTPIPAKAADLDIVTERERWKARMRALVELSTEDEDEG